MPTAKAPDILLAKSCKDYANPTESETLSGHTKNVIKSIQALSEIAGEKALESMGISNRFSVNDLTMSAGRAAALHDFGKANSQFQKIVRKGKVKQQALRHEWISTWLPLKSDEIRNWLFNGCPDLIRWACLFATIGHHLKIEDGSSVTPREGSGDLSIYLHLDHRDFYATMLVATNALSVMEPPKLQSIEIDLLENPLKELLGWFIDAKRWFDSIDAHDRKFLALIKALVISADVAGSALPKVCVEPLDWIHEVLKRVCTAEEIDTIVNNRLNGKPARSFQNKVACTDSNITFVNAGCGTGKTVAAYLWAAKHAAGKKLFICYPTTGTATEGFKDYVITSDLSDEAALLHSRADLDLEDILTCGEEDIYQSALQLESLTSWDVPLIVCTVDHVLGIIQNSRKSLYSFPSIANGAFVFDEIHQYDNRLFRALLRFIETFPDAPILMMTASLPMRKLDALNEVITKNGKQMKIVEGPKEMENIKKYIFKGIVKEAPWDDIEHTIKQNGKILWVSNTVNRCIQFSDQAKEKGLEPLIYHSRYRYCDRINRHNDVMEAFKGNQPAFAVTTQVCEVSLDISADLLITDIAPAPDIIQRLGRLNRRVTSDAEGIPKPVYFLDSGFALPYEQENIETAKNWVDLLCPGIYSQSELAESLKKLYDLSDSSLLRSEWLDSGVFASLASLRDAGGNLPVLMWDDEANCRDKGGRPVMKEIKRYSIPMPFREVWKETASWKKLAYAFLAPREKLEYSPVRGGKWRKQ